jgi:hypothetical protein
MQNNHQCVIRAAGICFALAGLTASMIPAVRGRGSQEAGQTKLSVKGARPVAEAIEMLEKKYGWVITYEDPRYAHDSEIVDVALEVRRDLDKYKPGEVPPVFVPKGGLLEFTYDVPADTNLPPDPPMVVQQLLDAHAASGNGGKFRLETSKQVMHVIPAMIKNRDGTLVLQESLLDTLISLPAVERTVYEKMDEICKAVSRAANMHVGLGMVPNNWFHGRTDQQGAKNQKAKDVLISTFEALEDGTNLSWRLFYGPGRGYSLNIHYVAKQNGQARTKE